MRCPVPLTLQPLLLLFVSAAGLCGCATPTVFRGEAHFPGGPAACEAKCAESGLVAKGFVFAGEFSSACVCEVPDTGRAPVVAAPGSGRGAPPPEAPKEPVAPAHPSEEESRSRIPVNESPSSPAAGGSVGSGRRSGGRGRPSTSEADE